MSWLLFLDESGHDHRTMPYEVHGGIAVHASKVWPLVKAVRTLEQSLFGTSLTDHGSEIKGSKLLRRDRFKWAAQDEPFDPQALRKHALNFLNTTQQKRTPRRDEFTAFGQACLRLAQESLQLLQEHGAKVFAAFIPPIAPPASSREDVPRKDIVFLLERYYYFLEESTEMGLLVMDQSDKQNDRKLVRRMEKYFVDTATGLRRAQRVVPTPFFVESDMASAVQLADLCVYCLNWSFRLEGMDTPIRDDLRGYADLLRSVVWHGAGRRKGKHFKTHSLVYVPDPYSARESPKKEKEVRPSAPPWQH